MRITIFGGGPIGLAYAALLTSGGHHVRLSSTRAGAGTLSLNVRGAVSFAGEIELEPEIAAATRDADVIICTRAANGVQPLIDALTPCLAPHQTLIFSAELSLAALYADAALARRGVRLPVISWSTTVATARMDGPGQVVCGTVRDRIDYAVTSPRSPDDSEALLNDLFGPRFHRLPNALAVALSNLNPQIHLANALANLTRIERGEVWENYACITPAVGRLIEALDHERLALAERCGVRVRTVSEHYLSTFPGIAPGSVSDMAAQVHASGPSTPGPRTLDTRYLTEDIPFGLAPLVRLAGPLQVGMPLHRAGIRLASAMLGRTLEDENPMLAAVCALAEPGLAADRL